MHPTHYAGISDWLSDTSNDILKRIAAGAAAANQWIMLKAIDLINSGLRINLGASWFQEVLAMMRYLVLPLVALLFLLQVITATIARSPSALWRAVWGSALGLILGSACAVLTAGLLLIVDQFSAYLLGSAQTTAQDGIKKAFEMNGAIEGNGWLIVTVIALLSTVAWGAIIVVLFLRKAIVLGTVVFGPFAMAGLTSGKTKSWAVRWAEVVVALALSKFVICAILTLGFHAVEGSLAGDITDALLGSVWIFLAAFSPLALLRFVTFAGDQIAAANVSGIAGAASNARRAGGMSIGGAGAIGGMAGAAGGWLAGRASAGTKSSTPLTPSTAVGSPRIGGSSVSKKGAATPASLAASMSPATQTEPAPGGSSGSSSSSDGAVGSAGQVGGQQSSSLVPIDAGISGRPVEQPDLQVQPAMDSFLADTAGGTRSPVVKPTAAAAKLQIPQTQVDRMFMAYEARGVVGPQNHDGARQILKPPAIPEQSPRA